MIISFLLASAVAAAAQTPASLDAALSSAFDRAVAAAKAAPTHCPDAKELETSFEATIAFADGREPIELRFAYEGCQEADRNDYLPPYTERYYEGQGGYKLTIITDEGRPESEVLLSLGKEWIGRLRKIENTKLVSGEAAPIAVEGLARGSASLRNAAVPLYPQLLPCEEALKTAFGADLRDSRGKPLTGYASRAMSLVLLTPTDAYYYHEDCDICAEITKCELRSRAISSVLAKHSVSCADMAPYAKDAVFDSCAAGR